MRTIIDVSKEIGLPATLEQLAEECAELAHAALKLARIERGENPTPSDKEEVLAALREEAADVSLCIFTIEEAGLLNRGIKAAKMTEKAARWEARINENKAKKN